ncbi:hypothetical protein V8F06_004132 [Rhypophila decipiens]
MGFRRVHQRGDKNKRLFSSLFQETKKISCDIIEPRRFSMFGSFLSFILCHHFWSKGKRHFLLRCWKYGEPVPFMGLYLFVVSCCYLGCLDFAHMSPWDEGKRAGYIFTGLVGHGLGVLRVCVCGVDGAAAASLLS